MPIPRTNGELVVIEVVIVPLDGGAVTFVKE